MFVVVEVHSTLEKDGSSSKIIRFNPEYAPNKIRRLQTEKKDARHAGNVWSRILDRNWRKSKWDKAEVMWRGSPL